MEAENLRYSANKIEPPSGSDRSKRKIYEVLETIAVNVNKVMDFNNLISQCLDRIDGGKAVKEPAEQRPGDRVRPRPFEEMDLFSKISYLSERLNEERIKLEEVHQRLDSLV